METEENAFDYDVFISYCDKDKAWVHRKLLRRLKNAGLDVFIDSDFRIGAPSVKEMERGVISSRKMIIVMTQEYLVSRWTEFEGLLAQTLDAANQDSRILPILLTKCELPLRLKYMTYIDLTNPDGEKEKWSKLINTIKDSRFGSSAAATSTTANNVVPVITFAMNSDEVDELLSGEIFMNKDVSEAEGEAFNSLLAELTRNGVDKTELYSYYKASRDAWSPKITGFLQIQEIVDIVFTNVNEKTKPNHKLMPQLISDDFIGNSHLLKDLRNKKSILIIDSISLFHPYLMKKLISSGLVSTQNPNLALIVIPPINHNKISIYEFLDENYKSSLGAAFEAFSKDLDIDYEFGIGNMQSLQRWLAISLMNIANGALSMHESRLAVMNERYGNPPGYGKVIFGRR